MGRLCIAGGRVLCPDLSVERADVVVDEATGRIERVTDAGGGDGEVVVDATGGVVLPGLVNAHSHVAMTLLRGYADDKPLRAWLEEDIWPVEAHLTAEDVRAGAELGLVEMIKSGTTGFADMYFYMDEVVDAVVEAGVRARLGHGVITVGKDEEGAMADVETGLAFADAHDGAAGGRVRTAVMPHSLATVGPEYLEVLVEGAREVGVPVHYHANETIDHQVEPVVDAHGVRPLEYAADAGVLEAGDFLAHCVHLTDQEVEVLAASGAGVVHCPASNMKLASGLAPVQRLLDAGVPVGIGTDGAASNNDLDLFGEMRDAAMVGKIAADDAAAVSAEAVVRMGTGGGAGVLGFESGGVAEGAVADVIVVDFDQPHLTPRHGVVSHLVYAARGADVRHTVCDGRVLMRDREVVTLDEAGVMASANEHAASLLERAGAA